MTIEKSKIVQDLDRHYHISDPVMFFFATVVLVAILIAGFFYEPLQLNVLFLTVMSLSVAIVFAFLPFSAHFEHQGLFKAGGTAAIFAVCLWQTVPFAKEMIRADHERDQKALSTRVDSAELDNLRKLLDTKNSELSELRKAVEAAKANSAATPHNDLMVSNLKQLSDSLSRVRQQANAAMDFSRAAQSNYSDSRTCSTRAGQAIEQLVPISTILDGASSAVSNAQAAIR